MPNARLANEPPECLHCEELRQDQLQKLPLTLGSFYHPPYSVSL
jgi:hypothetical protein